MSPPFPSPAPPPTPNASVRVAVAHSPAAGGVPDQLRAVLECVPGRLRAGQHDAAGEVAREATLRAARSSRLRRRRRRGIRRRLGAARAVPEEVDTERPRVCAGCDEAPRRQQQRPHGRRGDGVVHVQGLLRG
ncbi:hypothetical protein Pelo_19878 [Pelomyxa schiedti]|nr:hypothetical protein Pelo_19878 [Pelomyxa schiedti]